MLSGPYAPSPSYNLRRCSLDITTKTPPCDETSQISIAFKSTDVHLHPPIPRLAVGPGHSSRLKDWLQPQQWESSLIGSSSPRLDQSNLHRKTSHSSAIEISEKWLPRVQSSPPPPHAEATGQHSPSSPDFQLPSEEEQRKRRLQKLMRTLGEHVPPELIQPSGTKPINNANAFPEPAQTNMWHESREKEQNKRVRLARRGSLTQFSFPNLSSVAATLRAAGHARGESRSSILSSSVTTEDGSQEVRDMDHGGRKRLEPLRFFPGAPKGDVALPQMRAFHGDSKARPATTAGTSGSQSQRQGGGARGAKRPRRVKLQTSTVPPPVHQIVRPDVMEPAPELYTGSRRSLSTATTASTSGSQSRRQGGGARGAKRPRRANLQTSTVLLPVHQSDILDVTEPVPEVYTDSRRSQSESSLLSPMIFSKSPFQPTVGDEVGVEGDSSSLPHTPPLISRDRNKPHADSESACGSHSTLSSSSNLDLVIAHSHDSHCETPCTDSSAPSEVVMLALLSSETIDSRDVVARKERRQGWSGEWNREDMQDVIDKLRSLK